MRIILFYILLITSAGIYAQEVVPEPGTSPMQQDPVQDPDQQARSLSGALKDLLGQVHQHLGKIDQSLKQASAEGTNELLVAQQTDLLEARTDLEAALNQVNSGDRANWPLIKSNAEDVIGSVSEKLKEIKEASASAVN